VRLAGGAFLLGLGAVAHADPASSAAPPETSTHVDLALHEDSPLVAPGPGPLLRVDLDPNLGQEVHYELSRGIGPFTLRFTLDTQDDIGTGVVHVRRGGLEIRKDWRVTRWIRPFVSLGAFWELIDEQPYLRAPDKAQGFMLSVGTTF
jgi:hypothetical protein